MKYKISLSAVKIPPETLPLMMQSLEAGLIAHSEYVERFEQSICDYVGAKYCIAVSNGTMADAIMVAAMKNAFPNIKRVVVPALTFIAQPNSVRYNGLEVVFADVGRDWNLDVSQIGYFPDTILFMTDLMGRPIRDENLPMPMIEDACEAFGSKRGDKFAGTFGWLGSYSFYPSHTISTGEGGAIVTDNSDWAELCRSIRSHGAISNDPMDKFHFPNFGFNARMTTMQAVIGMAVMLHVHEYVEKRREIFSIMQKSIGGFDENGDTIVPHGFPVAFNSEMARNTAMGKIVDAGIECRKFFSCIPTREIPYMQSPRFPVAEQIARTHLYLPCHQNMTPEDVDYILEILNDVKDRL